MRIIILGQPRSGKSTLAKRLSEKLSFDVVCTDKYRREWGYHEPWKGYDTEVNPLKQKEFYERINEVCNLYENVILEGNAISPKDIEFFDYDSVVLLARNITPEEKVKYSRLYDGDAWTSKRDDEYLLELFNDYCKYSEKWAKENPDILVDTTNFFEGIDNAYNRILKEIGRI